MPYWVYPGHAKIVRMILIRPFSREVERYENLKKSLATYRLAFGQPRQDDLIDLFSTFGSDVVAELADLQISLKPSKLRSFPVDAVFGIAIVVVGSRNWQLGARSFNGPRPVGAKAGQRHVGANHEVGSGLLSDVGLRTVILIAI